ncbi:MAG TPA: long-chain fatty acid--CoA ligase [Desulfomonilia bacterium]|nr:long-chain fatty acid--CoA ligase [Desulfomonilia bacterium]
MDSRLWHKHYDYNVPTTIRYPRTPAQMLFQLSVGSFPDKPCVNFYGTEISFWQVRDQMLRLSNALGKLGVKKGDRVGIHLPNCPQFPISYLATLSLGAIVVNMNPLYTPVELKHIMETTQMETLITFDMVLPNIRTLAKEVGLKRVVVTRVTDYIKGLGVSSSKDLDLNKEEGWHHFSELIDGTTETHLPRIQISPDDPAMIQFTGGTTGVPKGALLTHANIVAATFQVSLWGSPTISLIPPERRSVLSVLPYFHVYGNIVAMNWSFFNCATQILMPRFEIDELLGIIANFESITFFPAVPTMITAVINHPKATEVNLAKRLGLVSSGAAPMASELIEKVQDMGIFFNEGYGLSESTSFGIASPLLGMKKIGSIGIPCPDNDVRLVDVENGVDEVKQGKPGELIMKGPLIMLGYWNNPEETKGQLVDGWLHTGDIAKMDEDGYLFIVDRKKDMIIAGGFNIYPREIDEILYQHPKIAEAVTVGIPDEYRGETVKAYIVLKPGQTATDKEIIDFCKTKLTAYKVPKKVEFRDSLPKSAVGKILRKILRQEELDKLKRS